VSRTHHHQALDYNCGTADGPIQHSVSTRPVAGIGGYAAGFVNRDPNDAAKTVQFARTKDGPLRSVAVVRAWVGPA
jgi:hypothetical protein